MGHCCSTDSSDRFITKGRTMSRVTRKRKMKKHKKPKTKGDKNFNRLSIAAMMIPTHDTIVAIDSIYLPRWETTGMATAYDAGTELNDELCANIPGPFCMGDGLSVSGGEGYVHVANGIHGIGDLAPEVFDYRNPVAKVTVRRVW